MPTSRIPQKEKKIVSVYLDQKDLIELDQCALADGRSRSDYIVRVVKEHLRKTVHS